MKVKVLGYSEIGDYHVCQDERGHYHKLDLISDASFPEFKYTNNNDLINLVGSHLKIDETFPYLSFAKGVSFVEQTPKDRDWET